MTVVLLVVAAVPAVGDWDATLARERFVEPVPHGRLAVIVGYHLAQGLMLLGLVHSF